GRRRAGRRAPDAHPRRRRHPPGGARRAGDPASGRDRMSAVLAVIQSFRARDAVDIILVAVVIYRVLVMFRGTRAVQMLAGLGGLMIASFLARRLDLFSTSWILENFWSVWVLALVVLFQPEFRRALAQIGQSPLLQALLGARGEQQGHVIDDVVKAAESLAAKRMGALIVLERSTGLRNYAELGVPLDALVSADLLVSVFIRDNRVAAAGCFLPLSRNTQLGRALGTRHRAAVGLSGDRRRRPRGIR